MAEQDEIVNLRVDFDSAQSAKALDAFARSVRVQLDNLQKEFSNFLQGAQPGSAPARAKQLREEAALLRAQTAAENAAANAATSASQRKTAAANASTAATKAETAAHKANTAASLQDLRAQTAAQNAQNAAQRAATAAARITQQANGAVTRSFDAIGAAGQRAGLMLTAAVTAPIVALGNRAFEASNKLEAARALLNSVTHDAALTEAQMKALNKSAELPALDLPLALEASAKLQGLKFSFQESQKTIETWSNAVALSGGSLADTREITNQLTQALGKNKLELEDLQVIGARIPTLMGIIQERFGSLDKFKKLPAQEGVRALTEELAKLDKATPKASDRLENVWLAVDRALAPIGKTLADTLIPALEKLTPYLDSFAAFWEKLSPTMQLAAIGFAAAAAAIGPLLIAISSFASSIATLAALFGAGGVFAGVGPALASLAGPLALAAAAAGALYVAYKTDFAGIKGVVDDALAKFQTAKLTLEKFWAENKSIVNEALGNLKTALQAFAAFVKPHWEALSTALSVPVQVAWQIIKTAFSTGFQVIAAVTRGIAQLINGDWQGFAQTMGASAKTLNALWAQGLDNLRAIFKQAFLRLIAASADFASNMVGALARPLGTLGNLAAGLIQRGLAILRSLAPLWAQQGFAFGEALINALMERIRAAFPRLTAAMQAILNTVSSSARRAGAPLPKLTSGGGAQEYGPGAFAPPSAVERLAAAPGGSNIPPPPAPTGKGQGSKGAALKAGQQARLDAAKDELRLLDEQRATEEQHLRLALDAKEISEADYYAKSLALLDAYNLRYATAQRTTEAAIKSATRLSAAERANSLRDFQRQAFAASEERWQEERRLEIERANSATEADQQRRANQLAALKQADDLQLAEIKRMEDAKVLTHLEALERIQAIEAAAAARALAAKQAELAAAPAEDAKRQEELAAEILRLQNEERARLAALGNVRREARQKDLAQQQAEAAQDRALDASISSARLAAAQAELRQLESLGGNDAEQRRLRLELAQLELEQTRAQSAERVRLIQQERDATLEAERAKLEALRATAAADPDSQSKIDEQIAKLDALTAKYRELTAAIEEKSAADEEEAQRQENLAANQDERSTALANIAGVGILLQDTLGTLDKGVGNIEKGFVKFGVIAGGVFSQIARQMAATGKIGEALWKGLANFAAEGALAALKAWESAKKPEWIKSGLEQAAAAYAAFASFNVPSGILHSLASAGYFALAGGALSGVAGAALGAVRNSGEQSAQNTAQTAVATQTVAANSDPRRTERPVEIQLDIRTRTEAGTILEINNHALRNANGLFRSLVASTGADGPIAI